MITLAFALFGALFGILLARKRGGNRLDRAQYAAILGLIFAVIGIFVTILYGRMG